jgi:hypothetical protein
MIFFLCIHRYEKNRIERQKNLSEKIKSSPVIRSMKNIESVQISKSKNRFNANERQEMISIS